MPPSSTTQPIVELRSMFASLLETVTALRDDQSKIRVQTGELAATRNQIAEMDRALRGYDGQRGLIARFDLLEQTIDHLVSEQIPALTESVQRNTGKEIELCRANRTLATAQLQSELISLRQDYQRSMDELRQTSFGSHPQ